MKKLYLLKFLLLFFVFNAFVADAAVRYVNVNNANSGSGTSWATAFNDLQMAIDAATDGDVIWVAAGTYQRASLHSFSMKEGVKIYGGFTGTENSLTQRNWRINVAILKGNNASVITNNNLTVAAELDGFTITDGNSSGGAGMTNQRSSPTIRNCIFTGNRSDFAKGIFNYESSPSIINCIFSNNLGLGYHIVNNQYSSPKIFNCLFASTESESQSIQNFDQSSPTLINCTLANTIDGSVEEVVNLENSDPTIINCIIWGTILNSVSSPTIANSIVKGGDTQNMNKNSDPLFINATNPLGVDGIWGTADDGLRLKGSSPALNAGNNAAIPTGITTDLSGAARIQGSTVDMGAYEVILTTLPLKLLSFTGKRFNGVSTLSWQTANEEKVKNFELQKGNDAGEFVTVATVTAKNGQRQNYTQEHYTTTSGTLYYQLKMLDNDGSFTESDVVALSDKGDTAAKIYPNPVSTMFTITTTNSDLLGKQMSISDVRGVVVLKQKLNDNNQQVNVAHLAAGVYFLKFANGDVMKFIKE